MARYLGPKKKLMRRFRMIEDGKSSRIFKKRKSDFAIRLEEKQKLKFIYGILERQLRRYVEIAMKSKGVPAENLLRQLEMRLDNVVYRLGWAKTRQQARQLVSHRHVIVNGKKVNIPSYQVSPGDDLTLAERIKNSSLVNENLDLKSENEIPSWMIRSGKNARILNNPKSLDFRQDLDMAMIIEYYSR